MIPQQFEYSRPGTLDEALSLLADGEKKVLAGGMSLIPMMKLRLAAPEHLVDLGRVPGLAGITEEESIVRIGALTTHYQIESSTLLLGRCPLLAVTAAHIGDLQVRNMGTIGGSVAHNDPAADYPAALVALEAQVRLSSKAGDRTVAIDDFFVDTLTTSLEPGEIVREILVRGEEPGTGVSYHKMAQPASGYAMVGVAVRVRKSGNKVTFARIGVTGVSNKAYRALGSEAALLESGNPKEAAAVVADSVDANSDLHASAEYRKHCARVYAERAIAEALSRAS
jgi:carbon-monoxide dehydrogenase medium subunit